MNTAPTPSRRLTQDEWSVIADKMNEPPYSEACGMAETIDAILLDGATDRARGKYRDNLLAFIDGLDPGNPAEALLATNAALLHVLTLDAARGLICGAGEHAELSRARRDFIALTRAGAEMLHALQYIGANIRARGEVRR